MGQLKTIAKHLAIRAGRLGAVQRRLGSLSSLHWILQRQLLFERLGIDLVLDVGANEGQFAGEVRNIYPGEIISFEPVSSAYAKLAANSSRDPLWKTKQLALGEDNATGSINVAKFGTFNSFLKTSSYCDQHFGPDAGGASTEAVSVRRLDDVLTELVPDIQQRRAFLKVDTQGYDLRVLRGLGDKLGCFSAVQCEVSMIPLYNGMPHWTETLSFLERAGFAPVGFAPVVVDNLAVVESDCLLIRVAARNP